MGFHIPDSPPRRATTSASSQTTTTAASQASDTNAVQFSERFSSRRVVRRRNALIPTLSIDVVGSPRSPFVCLSRNNRMALSQQHEQAQQQTSFFVSCSSNCASGDDSNGDSSSSSSSDGDVVKHAPCIRRRSDQRDADMDASFASRASLNAHTTP